ncbi:MAG TPA: DnaJ domain-containing protein [Gemmatimonadales bacterium]|nr:DnaJ domain-containing protein [Gemmatimonadales bacterium]
MDAQFLIEVETLAAALDQLDYFALLEVPRSAAPPEIKAAYHRQSRTFHPDRYAAVPSAALRDQVARIYRRVNEAYTVLRDDRKRARYRQDVEGPERERKLRFTEVEETLVKVEQKRRLEEQLGQTPKGRRFYAAALADIQAGRWEAAERGLKSALMFEPENARFKEQLVQVQVAVEKARPKGDYRIK